MTPPDAVRSDKAPLAVRQDPHVIELIAALDGVSYFAYPEGWRRVEAARRALLPDPEPTMDEVLDELTQAVNEHFDCGGRDCLSLYHSRIREAMKKLVAARLRGKP